MCGPVKRRDLNTRTLRSQQNIFAAAVAVLPLPASCSSEAAAAAEGPSLRWPKFDRYCWDGRMRSICPAVVAQAPSRRRIGGIAIEP